MDADRIELSEVAPTGDGILVVTFQGKLPAEQISRMSSILAQRFPARKWLVLDQGATVQDTAAAARLEAKIDLATAMLRTLIAALAEEEGTDEVVRPLDGGPAYGARDTDQPL